MVKVSVIIPIYNDGDYIEKSIDSILNQSLKDIEIICVNDGSTDDSLKILNNLSSKIDNLKVFDQENQGPAKARNKGMDESKGEYISFLDADDFFIDSDALERLYAVTIANDANMVSGNIKLVDGEGNYSPFRDLDYYENDGVILPEEYGIPWGFYKSIYKRDFLIDNSIYFPDLIRGEDPAFLAEVLAKVDKIFTVSCDFYAYYYIDGGAKCDTYKIRYDHIHQFKLVFEHFSEERFSKLKEAFKRKLFIFIDMMGLEGAKDTLSAIRDVFCDDPDLIKECEDYYYAKFFNDAKMLSELDLVQDTKISVIIPVYNAEPFIEEALDTVVNQSFRDIELICVNDGSKDNSLEILNKFSNADSRVKVINQNNQGCGAARNRALSEAKGDYIYFFDPDDYILPGTFEKLYYNATRNCSDLVIFKIARFIEGEPTNYSVPGFDFEKVFGNIDFNNFTFDYHDVKEYVLNRSFAPWTKLYKKEFLDEYDDFRFPTDIAFDDVPFHVKSMLRASKISYIPEFFYYYRFNPNSVNNTASNGMDIFRICDIIEDFLKTEGYFEEFIDEFKLFKITQITYYILSTGTQDYFDLAKSNLSEMDVSDIKISNELSDKFNLVLESESIEDYEINLKQINHINSLKQEKKRLIAKKKKLKKENKNLKRKFKSLKQNDSAVSEPEGSNLTKTLRKINIFKK